MTIQEAQQQLLSQLHHIYNNREAATIADWIMEHITGWKKIDRVINKQAPLLPERIALLKQFTAELLAHKPVQYVLHEAWFCGMPFYVNEQVLIPRPETEELVEWVVEEAGSRGAEPDSYRVRSIKPEAGGLKSEAGSQKSPARILDVGTGSGCIAVALKKKLPEAVVYACDVSKPALAVAEKNSVALQAHVQFIQLDILDKRVWAQLPDIDIIVSNPPYIPRKDQSTMQENVLQYEPHLALFVENDDPLLFYKAIADLGHQKLLPGGAILVEIHEEQGEAVADLFREKGYNNVVIKKDMQGKERMVRGNVK